MTNSIAHFIVLDLILSWSCPFIIAMISPKEDCDLDKLILPFNKKNPMPEILLPNNLVPLHYIVELQPHLPPGNSTFVGHVLIYMSCEISTSVITLHSRNLTIFQPTIQITSHRDTRPIHVVSIAYDLPNDFLLIHLNQVLSPNFDYNVSMSFMGSLLHTRFGFHQIHYYLSVNDTGLSWMALSQFKPTGARWAFPCFDEPARKATFDVIIVRPTNMMTVSNMKARTTTNRETGMVADYYYTSNNMSTYLVCFIVGEFSAIVNAADYKFRLLYRGAVAPAYHLTFSNLGSIQSYYEQYFKISFPLAKMDVIIIPFFQPDVAENWGAITIRESKSLYKAGLTSCDQLQDIIITTAHGFAHQLFGNLVTMNWWNNLWLNEGFASYFADYAADHCNRSMKVFQQFYAIHTMIALQKDCLDTTIPLSSPVRSVSEIVKKFNEVTHHKGAALIRMMKHFLRRDVLKNGLRNYLLSNAFLNTVQDDLWYYLDRDWKCCKMSVKDIMDTWTLQRGYPVVTITRNYAAETAEVSQKPFSLRTNTNRKQLWYIPLTYTTESFPNFGSTRPKFWLTNKGENKTLNANDEVPPADQWMIFNIRASAYCVINYDLENWDLLTKALLKNDTLMESGYVNVAQLIHDSFILSKARQLNYAIALQLAKNIMPKENAHYLSWRAFGTAANELGFKLKYTKVIQPWNNYVYALTYNIWSRWGFVPPSTHLENLSQIIAMQLSLNAWNNAAITQGASLFDQITRGNITVNYGIEKLAACAALLAGQTGAFQHILQRYLNNTWSQWPSMKSRQLSYLNCANTSADLTSTLELTLNPNSGFHKRNFNQFFSIVASSKNGKPVAINFIQQNLQRLQTRFQGATKSKVTYMINVLARSFTTTEELNQLIGLINQVQTVLKYKDKFNDAIRTVKDNINWMKTSYFEIRDYLQENYS